MQTSLPLQRSLPSFNIQQVLLHLFKKGPTPASFCLFSVFSNKQYNFTTNPCEKMPCPSRKRHRDSNPRPLKHESSPITTRLGLPPQSILGCRTSLTVLQRRQTSLIIARNMCSSFSGKVQLNTRMSSKKILFWFEQHFNWSIIVYLFDAETKDFLKLQDDNGLTKPFR